MTPKTITAERREKFERVLLKFKVCPYDYATHPVSLESWLQSLISELVEASLSRSERATDETAAEYNTELFKGDWREYPEHLHETARVLRDVWNFVLPAKPQKKTKEFSKGKYSAFVYAMEQVKLSCGEQGVEKVLTALHDDWIKGFKNGLAPYTIAQPTSLINVAAGKAREMREGIGEVAHKTGRQIERLDR